MNFTKFLGVVALGTALTACAGFGTKEAVYTCTSAAALIDVAAEANRAGKITPADKVTIGKAIDKVATVCENPLAPTSEQLKQAAVDELVKLLREKAGVL